MILLSWVAVEVAVESYLRVKLMFKISARSDEPFRRRSADRQTDKQTDKQTNRQTSKVFKGHWSKGLRYRSAN